MTAVGDITCKFSFEWLLNAIYENCERPFLSAVAIRFLLDPLGVWLNPYLFFVGVADLLAELAHLSLLRWMKLVFYRLRLFVSSLHGTSHVLRFKPTPELINPVPEIPNFYLGTEQDVLLTL